MKANVAGTLVCDITKHLTSNRGTVCQLLLFVSTSFIVFTYDVNKTISIEVCDWLDCK